MRRRTVPIALLLSAAAVGMMAASWHVAMRPAALGAETPGDAPAEDIDPAAWGSDHVERPLPPFVSGDECLFCHRMDIGPAWPKNPHFLTVRRADRESPPLAALQENAVTKDFAAAVDYVLGQDRQVRFLKRTADYGRLAVLSTTWQPPASGEPGTLVVGDAAEWDDQLFGESCAGCHCSAVDPQTHAFSAISLDCFTCHGDVDLEHSKKQAAVIVSAEGADPARVVISVCGQCHIHTGKSKSTGLAYPNKFVAGDNLFRDFRVDWSEERLAEVDPIQRHILENVRDVAVRGQNDLTCLTCHDVHASSTEKHQQLAEQAICGNCHKAGRPKSDIKPLPRRSAVCGYNTDRKTKEKP